MSATRASSNDASTRLFVRQGVLHDAVSALARGKRLPRDHFFRMQTPSRSVEAAGEGEPQS
ncbi:MAG: hypothetical protein HYV07_19990 [Deltaproteobacteria bacterium]|nr:hypothetical protein [Deltaproteobacteria bacterium]